ELTWSLNSDGNLIGSLNGVAVLQLSLSDTSLAAGTTGNVTVTATQLTVLPHATGVDGAGEAFNFDNITISGITVVATDTDGDTAEGTLDINVDDSLPTALDPFTVSVSNTSGGTGNAYLDADNDVSNNYGADSAGSVIFTQATIDGLLSQGLSSGLAPLEYAISADGTVLTATNSNDDSVVFTITLQPTDFDDQYVVHMSQPVDSLSYVDFNNGGYDFVGGNSIWAGFTQADISNSQDLLLTAVNGTSTVNTTSSTGGIGNAHVNSGEGMRVDYVTDLFGDAKDIDTITFDGHYTVNGGSATFDVGNNNSSTVTVKAFDDADGNNHVGDGVQDTITQIAISYGDEDLVINAAGEYTVGGHLFTVSFSADGSASVEGVVNGTTLAAYTYNGYNSIEWSNTGGDSFQIGDFGATTVTTKDVSLSVPVVVQDGDGDTAPSSLGITLTAPDTPTTETPHAMATVSAAGLGILADTSEFDTQALKFTAGSNDINTFKFVDADYIKIIGSDDKPLKLNWSVSADGTELIGKLGNGNHAVIKLTLADIGDIEAGTDGEIKVNVELIGNLPRHFEVDDLTISGIHVEGTDTANVSVMSALDVKVLPSSTVVVSEEALPNGIPDDQSHAATASGTLVLDEAISPAVTLSYVGDTRVTVDDQPVSWSFNETTMTLVASLGDGTPVISIQLTAPHGNGNHSNEWSYEVTLSSPIDHPVINVEDILHLPFLISGNDAHGNPVTGSFTVKVEDDSPFVADDAEVVTATYTDIPNTLVGEFNVSGYGDGKVDGDYNHDGRYDGIHSTNPDGVGFTITALGFASATDSTLVSAAVGSKGGGIGVASKNGPYHNLEGEVDFREFANGTSASEQLIFTLDEGTVAFGMTLDFKYMFGDELETGIAYFYRDGELIYQQEFTSDASSGNYAADFDVQQGGFDKVVLEATNNHAGMWNDNSDFAIGAITFTGTTAGAAIAHASGDVEAGWGADGKASEHAVTLTVEDGIQTTSGAAITIATSASGNTIWGYTGNNPDANIVFRLEYTPETGKWDYFQYQALDAGDDGVIDFGITYTDADGDSSTGNIHVGLPSPHAAPETADFSVSVDEDSSYQLQLSHFSFNDADGDDFTHVIITSLPTEGVLYLDGVAVTSGQVIDVEEITAGNLTYTPADSSHLVSEFNFQVQDNGPVSLGGENTSTEHTATINIGRLINDGVTNGDNTLHGGAGNDIIAGDIGGTFTNVEPGQNYNIALVIDTSGSMNFKLDGSGNSNYESYNSRIVLIRDALINLSHQLAGHDGTINIALIGFADDATLKIDVDNLSPENIDGLISQIEHLKAGGATNYEAAFNEAEKWLTDISANNAAGHGYENLTYFLSDGDPTISNHDKSSGGTTDAGDIQYAVEAFGGLSAISQVHAIGIGKGITESTLQYFDNTDVVGSQPYRTIETRLTDFQGNNDSWDGAWKWSQSGSSSDSVKYYNGLLVIEDHDDSEVTQAFSPETALAFNEHSQGYFSVDFSTQWVSGNDTVELWVQQKLSDGSWSTVDTIVMATKNVSNGYLETNAISSSGTYRLVFNVDSDAPNSNYTQLRIEEINFHQTWQADIGNVSIVTEAGQLTAALQGGSQSTELADVGNDTVYGGDGNDIIFGDVINTDQLPWGASYGNPEKPADLPDGSGLAALEQFLQLKNGEPATDAQIYSYIKEHIDIFNVAGDTRGGDDTLYGGNGDDIIFGQGGDDTIYGGMGNDILTGGEGKDTFVWLAGETGTDHVTDFNFAQDKLDISDLLTGWNGNNDTLDDYLHIDVEDGNTVISIDANADHTVDQTIILDGSDVSSYGSNSSEWIQGLIGDGTGPLIVQTSQTEQASYTPSSSSEELNHTNKLLQP
ncbi:type I secretion C-terminal target domain-containing protein, partial [Shewanella sp. C32]